jgi:hypothetical protein
MEGDETLLYCARCCRLCATLDKIIPLSTCEANNCFSNTYISEFVTYLHKRPSPPSMDDGKIYGFVNLNGSGILWRWKKRRLQYTMDTRCDSVVNLTTSPPYLGGADMVGSFRENDYLFFASDPLYVFSLALKMEFWKLLGLILFMLSIFAIGVLLPILLFFIVPMSLTFAVILLLKFLRLRAIVQYNTDRTTSFFVSDLYIKDLIPSMPKVFKEPISSVYRGLMDFTSLKAVYAGCFMTALGSCMFAYKMFTDEDKSKVESLAKKIKKSSKMDKLSLALIFAGSATANGLNFLDTVFMSFSILSLFAKDWNTIRQITTTYGLTTLIAQKIPKRTKVSGSSFPSFLYKYYAVTASDQTCDEKAGLGYVEEDDDDLPDTYEIRSRRLFQDIVVFAMIMMIGYDLYQENNDSVAEGRDKRQQSVYYRREGEPIRGHGWSHNTRKSGKRRINVNKAALKQIIDYKRAMKTEPFKAKPISKFEFGGSKNNFVIYEGENYWIDTAKGSFLMNGEELDKALAAGIIDPNGINIEVADQNLIDSFQDYETEEKKMDQLEEDLYNDEHFDDHWEDLLNYDEVDDFVADERGYIRGLKNKARALNMSAPSIEVSTNRGDAQNLSRGVKAYLNRGGDINKLSDEVKRIHETFENRSRFVPRPKDLPSEQRMRELAKETDVSKILPYISNFKPGNRSYSDVVYVRDVPKKPDIVVTNKSVSQVLEEEKKLKGSLWADAETKSIEQKKCRCTKCTKVFNSVNKFKSHYLKCYGVKSQLGIQKQVQQARTYFEESKAESLSGGVQLPKKVLQNTIQVGNGKGVYVLKGKHVYLQTSRHNLDGDDIVIESEDEKRTFKFSDLLNTKDGVLEDPSIPNDLILLRAPQLKGKSCVVMGVHSEGGDLTLCTQKNISTAHIHSYGKKTYTFGDKSWEAESVFFDSSCQSVPGDCGSPYYCQKPQVKCVAIHAADKSAVLITKEYVEYLAKPLN